MVEKIKPYQLPRDKSIGLAQHRANLVVALGDLAKLEDCGAECQISRAEIEGEMARIDNLLGGFAPAAPINDGTK